MKRFKIQLIAFFLTNSYIKGFLEGKIFKGKIKNICVPGLNCYSCPGAIGSCPIGALQAVMGSIKYQLSFYVMGLMMLFGTLLGRLICGYLCPFGLVQDLAYKIKTKKRKLYRPLTFIRYAVLVIFVLLIPTFFSNELGMGEPGFCKYICPAGTMMASIPLLILNKGLRLAIGALFTWKLAVLVIIMFSSIFYYRFFCRVLCPLGVIYGLFNKISFYGYTWNEEKCVSCGKCKKVCKIDLDPICDMNHPECIRCGECKEICDFKAIERKHL